jgi:hypothetical protein
MPTDPLVAMLAGGNEGAAANPFMLEAAPQLQLAQQLQQAGMSTAPASPAQGWGRLAQALAGTVMRHEATSDLAKAISGTSSKMAQLFPEGSIMRAGLSSDDPLVQAVTWQQIPKTIPLLSQAEKLGPNEVVRGIPANAPAGQPLAAGSPAQAGKVAGAEAAARAPYLPGGPATQETENGPREIEQTALERAQAARGRAGGALSPKLQPLAPSQGQPQGGTQQPAAGTVMQGKPLPNPAIEPAVKVDTEELSKDREKALAGQADMANVRLIQDFVPKVQTGWGAETKLEAARILKTIGVPQDVINKNIMTLPDVASGQILQKKFVELSAAAARTMGAREPGSVISMFAKSYPNLGTDPQAITLQTNALYMDRLRSQHLAEQKTNFLNDSINGVQGSGQYRGLRGFNEAFNRSNPAESYLHAAEAMSGATEPWKRVTTMSQRNAVIRLIPPGTAYMGPDNKMHVTPGAGSQQ